MVQLHRLGAGQVRAHGEDELLGIGHHIHLAGGEHRGAPQHKGLGHIARLGNPLGQKRQGKGPQGIAVLLLNGFRAIAEVPQIGLIARGQHHLGNQVLVPLLRLGKGAGPGEQQGILLFSTRSMVAAEDCM